MSKCSIFAVFFFSIFCLTVAAAPPSSSSDVSTPMVTMDIDQTAFIDANKIFMFVTNFGIFGRDVGDVFIYDHGTFYPYIGTEYIESGTLFASPLYAAGLWLGAIDSASGETRVVIAEFSSEYTPGPMAAGTFQPDNPDFRVYKLYSDSLESNPNQDYLEWPTDQGAPVDELGHPLMRGDQTLWTVFNDANPDQHINDAGGTNPLGIEVRQMTWATDEAGSQVIPRQDELIVDQYGNTDITVSIAIVDSESVTGHNYMVVIDSSETLGPVWHLLDLTSPATILQDRPISAVDTIVGVEISVDLGATAFSSFEVVANAAGPLDPPEPGALWFAGFPVPTEYDPDGYISERQQSTSDAMWALHTADDGGSCEAGGGTRGSYDAFLARVLRNDNVDRLGVYDFEMRFTGSNDNPGVAGSYAIEAFNDDNIFWVPYELWRTGIGTPDDPSDDVRLVPFIMDHYGLTLEGDDQYALESWGCDATGSGDWEHSASGSDNDPYTDWVYWYEPLDMTPGLAGYAAVMTEWVINGDIDAGYFLLGDEILARTVLINWNGGIEPPFLMDTPEQGTVFRICTSREQPRDTFTFTATIQPEITTGDEGVCIYQEYWVYNKGGNTLEDCYVSLWSDPDIGLGGDDLVGCDSLNNLFFAYNADSYDSEYGYTPPAMGFKYLVGPLIPWPGETVDILGGSLTDHKDIGMTGFTKYINGTDPDNFGETYGFLMGLTKSGDPYEYGGHITTYMVSGDPVAGTGDLDMYPADRRMMGISGPFTFRPNDSLYMLIRMTAKHGDDYLDAVTELKRVLNLPYDLSTDVADESPQQLPDRFAVNQNYPNPFNPATSIQYSLPERAHVKIEVFNILGQKVQSLVDETKPAGIHTVVWDGTDETGNAVATGMYFYRVKAGDFIDSKKMLMVK